MTVTISHCFPTPNLSKIVTATGRWTRPQSSFSCRDPSRSRKTSSSSLRPGDSGDGILARGRASRRRRSAAWAAQQTQHATNAAPATAPTPKSS